MSTKKQSVCVYIGGAVQTIGPLIFEAPEIQLLINVFTHIKGCSV